MDSDGFSSPQFIFKLEELAFRDNITRVSQVLADFLLPVSTAAKTHHLTGLLEKSSLRVPKGMSAGMSTLTFPLP
jgi:hypothetical protein